MPNPLADFDIQKLINGLIDNDKEIYISAIQREKVVPNPLSPHIFNNDPTNVEEASTFLNEVKVSDTQSESSVLDNQRSRELENTFTDFVSHQSSNGDEKHTNPIINVKKANPMINVKEADPMINVKEADPMINVKETDPMINIKEANPIQEKLPGSHHSGVVAQNSENSLKRARTIEWGEFLKFSNSLQVKKPWKPAPNQNAEGLAKTMSVDDEVMKSFLDNYQDLDDYYDWKNWDKKISDHLSGVVPVESSENPKRTWEWGEFLKFSRSLQVKKPWKPAPNQNAEGISSSAENILSKLPRHL